MISQIYGSPEVPANPGAKTTTTQTTIWII